ncbi:MAG: response regulator [Spirochaetia bacterium]|nr:response regulator [Spirochaetia bacterium]
MGKKILVIDDEESIIYIMKELFGDLGHRVTGKTDPKEGKQEALEGEYDLIIVDLRMPGMDGAEVTEAIMEKKPEARILINTGFPGDPLARRALDAGALSLIRKPFEIEKVYDFLK